MAVQMGDSRGRKQKSRRNRVRKQYRVFDGDAQEVNDRATRVVEGRCRK